MRRFLATVATWVGALIAFALVATRIVLDLIGYSTSPEDAEGVPGKAVAVLNWVASQPWLIAYGVPALLIGFGALTLWPHPAPAVTPSPPPQPIIVEPPKPSVQHTPLETSHVEGRGYYHEGTVWIVSPFAVNNLVVEVYGSKNIINVSVIRSGLNSQSQDGNEERIRIKCKQPGSDVYTVLINTRNEEQPVVKYFVE